MVSLTGSLYFMATALLLALAPGPDNIYVLLLAMSRGRRAGFSVVLGLCTGLLGHTAAVALGLAALFAHSVLAFRTIQWLGAAYLGWLGWQALRTGPLAPGSSPSPSITAWTQYRRGVIMNLANPKVVIFFLSLLPQFTEPQRGPVGPQILWLGCLFIVATLIVFGSIVLFAAKLGHWLQHGPNTVRCLQTATGILLLALATRLALAQR